MSTVPPQPSPLGADLGRLLAFLCVDNGIPFRTVVPLIFAPESQAELVQARKLAGELIAYEVESHA